MGVTGVSNVPAHPSERDKLRQKLLSAEHAGDWLLHIPGRQLGTLLPSSVVGHSLQF